jgi:hypothetical protein
VPKRVKNNAGDGSLAPLRDVGLAAGDGRADDGENARADDGADAEGGERPGAEGLLEAVLRVLGVEDQLVNRFATKQLGLAG